MGKNDKFTAKNYPISKAPDHITLIGDRRRPESAQHIIEFPGGAIELTRTTDGDYWAHIIVNRGPVLEEGSTRETARGRVIGSRIFREDAGLADIPDDAEISQIAVLIGRETSVANERREAARA